MSSSDDSPTNSGVKVVVGLGNPGAKYDKTRHNIGFEVIDALSRRLLAPDPTSKFNGLVASCSVETTKLLLIKPQTYMNLSGRCVAAAAKFYKINVEKDLMVVCDDLSLPLGKLRIRAKGSAGGQNGLKDILNAVGTQAVARLRVGIDSPPPQWDAADYVLGKFKADERETVSETIRTAADAILDWCRKDISYSMNQYN